MGTEETRTVPTESPSLPKYASWVAGLVGLWILVSPFVVGGSLVVGPGMWSTVVSGIAVLVLAAFGAYGLRTASETDTNTPGEVGGWLAALIGLWVTVSPFAFDAVLQASLAKWSNVVAGLLVLILCGYAGYVLHSRA